MMLMASGSKKLNFATLFASMSIFILLLRVPKSSTMSVKQTTNDSKKHFAMKPSGYLSVVILLVTKGSDQSASVNSSDIFHWHTVRNVFRDGSLDFLEGALCASEPKKIIFADCWGTPLIWKKLKGKKFTWVTRGNLEFCSFSVSHSAAACLVSSFCFYSVCLLM